MNHIFGVQRAVLACSALTVLLAFGGCSMFHRGEHESAAPPPPTRQVETTAAPEQQTVTEAAAEAADESGTTTVISDAGPDLKSSAPRNYVVRRGDTLWGIANTFLRDPWLWPEIWYINPDIHNPHRIYPGDSVRLALRGDGHTALQVVRGGTTRLEPMLRSVPLEGPIATIPYSVIAAFLSRPGVLTGDEVKSAPYVAALRDDHQIAGTGHDLYIRKLDAGTGARYSVMHIDEPLHDPQSGRKLGYVAIYTGTAQVTRPGEIAKATLTDAARETLQGDVLIAEESSPTGDFAPHGPAQAIDGRIIAVVDNVLLAGQYDVVALNRGSQDGLDRGSVLTIDQAGPRVDDHCAKMDGESSCWISHGVRLPDESVGTLLVFKTYERMSYALILSDTVPVNVGDHIRNP
ncbi:MAG TPA: LysM peptidoglycan-binding domain-containing protein [Steroidobacteraceae bacterium]|nr:LysM peptidoglycan-binding domain-containing protein [Steroidobacteraceae bacterium]